MPALQIWVIIKIPIIHVHVQCSCSLADCYVIMQELCLLPDEINLLNTDNEVYSILTWTMNVIIYTCNLAWYFQCTLIKTTSDSGTSDSEPSDSGTSDSGPSDSGTSDSGTSDSGPSDSGPSE